MSYNSRQWITSYLSKEQMLKMSTKRLLAYRKSLYSKAHLSLPNLTNSESDAEYARVLAENKEVLDSREHIKKKKYD